MNVEMMHLHNLFSHDRTTVDLPPAGLVVVTGPNGAGKSSFAECVSVACWGKTLRGTPAWRPTGTSAARVRVAFHHGEENQVEFDVERCSTNGKSPALAWADTADELAEGDKAHDLDTRAPEWGSTFTTTTKAQQALEHEIGPWDVWRRSHVFSSSDAAHFTLSTDAERKRLLEAVLGLDRFDAALKICRADLRVARDACAAKERDLAGARSMQTAQSQRVLDAEQAIEALGARPARQVDLIGAGALRSIESAIEAINDDIAGERRALASAQIDTYAKKSRANTAQDRLAQLSNGACPVCAQPIGKDLAASLQKESIDAATAAQAAANSFARANEERGEVVKDLEEEATLAQDQRMALVRKREQSTAARATLERWDKQKAHHVERLGMARTAAKEASENVVLFKLQLEQLESESATIGACERVLGLRGVRSHVLGRALGGLETVANDWLVRLRCDLKLKLRPYSATKGGGANDAIGLDVEGAGAGYGYKATSGGERRRIDVALVFALGAVAGAAYGRGEGTLFMDEVFDCLDDEGEAAVVDALQDLARDRCVVVVTHSKTLAQSLPATRHLRVEAGRVRVA